MICIRVLLAVAGAIAYAIGSAQAEIVIATAGPMTGPYAAFGEQMRRGAQQAVQDINAAGGVLGEQLVLEIGDDICDPKEAVAVANQMVNTGVAFMAGHFCSGSSIPASQIYHEEGILQISPASTHPLLTEQGFENVFRVGGRDDSQARVAADYVIDHVLGIHIAIIHDQTAYGKGLADEFKKTLNRLGVEEAMYEAITPGEKNFTALITKMKDAGVDLIYLGGYHTEAGLITRQAREQGLDAILMSGDALVTDEYWAITGDAGQGTLMTFSPDPRELETAKSLVARFHSAGYDPEGYTLYTYAAIQLWAQAAAKAGSDDVDAVARELKSNIFDTILGRVTFDKKGDARGIGYTVYTWNEGRYFDVSKNTSLAAVPQSAKTPALGQTIEVALHDAIPSGLVTDQQVRINGVLTKITSLDQSRKALSFLGGENIFQRGLNILDIGTRKILYWNEERILSRFETPYKDSYAIISAIDDYDRRDDPQERGPTGYKSLENMVGRAKELEATLIELGFPRNNIISLYDHEATSANLNEALAKFWKGGEYDGASRLVFYFGGHGDGEEGYGYLVTYDFDRRQPTRTSFLMGDFVGRQFQYVTAHHFLVALDSCGSGLAIPGRVDLSARTDEVKLKRFATLAAVRSDVEGKARNLLAAGTGEQRALWETGGIFTKALIDGLGGNADLVEDGVIQFDELALHVDRVVTVEAASVGVRQDPYAFSADLFGTGKTLFLLQP